MNVDLTPEQQRFVQQAIASGRIHRPEDAAQEAFSLWVEREHAKARTRDTARAQAAVDRIRELRQGNRLPEGLTLRDMIEAGRD